MAASPGNEPTSSTSCAGRWNNPGRSAALAVDGDAILDLHVGGVGRFPFDRSCYSARPSSQLRERLDDRHSLRRSRPRQCHRRRHHPRRRRVSRRAPHAQGRHGVDRRGARRASLRRHGTGGRSAPDRAGNARATPDRRDCRSRRPRYRAETSPRDAQFEALGADEMRDVAFGAGEEIVDSDEVGASLQQALAQMRAKKAGPAGHENGFFEMHGLFRSGRGAVLGPAPPQPRPGAAIPGTPTEGAGFQDLHGLISGSLGVRG
jgi:hypothetical protein